MAETLQAFVHEGNNETYLFGFEDYLSEEEMIELWDYAMSESWGNLNAPYGELDYVDIIESISDATGLRMPQVETPLWNAVISHARQMSLYEQNNLEETMRLGRDPDENYDTATLTMMQNMMRRTT